MPCLGIPSKSRALLHQLLYQGSRDLQASTQPGRGGVLSSQAEGKGQTSALVTTQTAGDPKWHVKTQSDLDREWPRKHRGVLVFTLIFAPLWPRLVCSLLPTLCLPYAHGTCNLNLLTPISRNPISVLRVHGLVSLEQKSGGGSEKLRLRLLSVLRGEEPEVKCCLRSCHFSPTGWKAMQRSRGQHLPQARNQVSVRRPFISGLLEKKHNP